MEACEDRWLEIGALLGFGNGTRRSVAREIITQAILDHSRD